MAWMAGRGFYIYPLYGVSMALEPKWKHLCTFELQVLGTLIVCTPYPAMP
jgi:hypothetical protein